jgi:carbonic anhydrase
MKSPIKLSAQQFEMFRKLYSVNNRPTQPTFARVPASSL